MKKKTNEEEQEQKEQEQEAQLPQRDRATHYVS